MAFERVVVDSNIYIGLLRRGIDPVTALGNWIGDGDLVTCGLIRVEVERGLRTPKLRRHLSGFFDVMVNHPITAKIWSATTDLAWSLDRSGSILPLQDLLIATVVIDYNAAILSDDSHFDLIPGVYRMNPQAELAQW